MKRVFLTLPYLDKVDPEAMVAARRASAGRLQVDGKLSRGSMLTRGFNIPWCEALNSQPAYDYFALIHSDVDPEWHWLDVLVGEMECHGFDVIHAVSPIKDHFGLTSTAYGRVDDEWATVRRVTTTELNEKLPPTFGIADLETKLGRFGFADYPLCLLCNTAVFVMSLNPREISGPGPFAIKKDGRPVRRNWPRCFPGFQIRDRIVEDETDFMGAESVSEDWLAGRWFARHGMKVGATSKVKVTHYGRHGFSSDSAWGMHKRDEMFFKRVQYDQDITAIGPVGWH